MLDCWLWLLLQFFTLDGSYKKCRSCLSVCVSARLAHYALKLFCGLLRVSKSSKEFLKCSESVSKSLQSFPKNSQSVPIIFNMFITMVKLWKRHGSSSKKSKKVWRHIIVWCHTFFDSLGDDPRRFHNLTIV